MKFCWLNSATSYRTNRQRVDYDSPETVRG